MKSWQSHDEIQENLDEIFGVPPQMKLNPSSISCRKADFIALAISSHASGIYPVRKDGFS